MSLFSSKKTIIFAEVANSHEGKIDLAKKITDEVSKTGAKFIKFQIFTADELLDSNHEKFSVFKKLEMTTKEWTAIIKYAKNKKLKVFADIFGIKSAKLASKLGVDGFKIHSTDISNPKILNFCAEVNKPILLSTAGCYSQEIKNAIQILGKTPKEIVLMHGFQGYPTQINELNLLRITSLKKQYDLPVGLMDHVSGDSKMALIIPLLGISLGAKIIEKHITLQRSDKGIDYYSSLNPNEFKELVSLIQKTEKSLGSGTSKFSINEKKYRLDHKKNPIAKKQIKKGTKLNSNLFEFKRTKIKHDSIPYRIFKNGVASNSISSGQVLNSSIVLLPPKIAAVIACRAESGRLYGKPVQNLNNIMILELLINQIKTSHRIDEIVLAISENPGNEIFVAFAKKSNIPYVIGDDHDVLKRLIDGAISVDANIIFRVTSENPFIWWEGIDDVIKSHIHGKFDFSFVDNLPIGSSYEIINLESLQKSHKEGQKKHRSELCSLFIYENQKLFRINKYQPPMELQKPNLRLTVDTPEDLLVARFIRENLGKKGKPISLKKVIKLLQNNPKVSELNASVPIGVTRIWD